MARSAQKASRKKSPPGERQIPEWADPEAQTGVARLRPTATRAMAGAWSRHAERLADWAQTHLVNRDDRHGKYYQQPDGTVRQCADPANARDAKAGHLDRGENWSGTSRAADTNDIVGVYAYDAEKQGKWVAIDIDNHDDKADTEANRRYALHLYDRVTGLGFVGPLVREQRQRVDFICGFLFASPVPATVLQPIREHPRL